MPAWTIRPFQPWDIGPVTSLVRSIRAEQDLGADFGGTGVDVRAVGVGDRSGTWVAELDGEVIGVVAVQPGEGDACVVQRLYVVAGHRRQGVGLALAVQVREWADDVGYGKVEAPDAPGADPVRRILQRVC